MFQALADPTRRRIVERLIRGPASVSELAAPMAMTLAGVAQHVSVLEQSGLIATSKVGRVRTCRLERKALRAADAWIGQRALLERRLARLDDLLDGWSATGRNEMIERSIAHGSFTVTRSYPHPVAKVFTAWSDPTIKRQWYGGPDQDDSRRVFEFWVGGRENNFGRIGDVQFALEGIYYDIVPEARIIYAYDVRLDGVITSLSVTTVEFRSSASGTELSMTEHGAFFDGIDNAEDRIGGTEWVLDELGKVLDRQPSI